MHSSEVEVGGKAYRYEVDDQDALTVWRVARAGETLIGTGRVESDGTRYKIKESAGDDLTEQIMFAIEQQLSGYA